MTIENAARTLIILLLAAILAVASYDIASDDSSPGEVGIDRSSGFNVPYPVWEPDYIAKTDDDLEERIAELEEEVDRLRQDWLEVEGLIKFLQFGMFSEYGYPGDVTPPEPGPEPETAPAPSPPMGPEPGY